MGKLLVTNISKKYKQYFSQKSRFIELITGGRYKGHNEIWVLNNINFQVQVGESVGIIGENGAGKSTLLKIITGATQATTGYIQKQGRLAALLELGMGFSPEFSGLQNAIMGLQILGMNAEKITQLLPKIAQFSELGDYFDKPLRTYSSGMHVRLAFSVATAVRPDILIIDEALSVGDAYFQHKSMARIRQFKEEGSTLFFVSHDPGAVKTLCDRAILLDKGIVVRDGKPDAVLDYYNAIIAKKEKDAEIQQVELQHGKVVTRSGNKKAFIISVELLDETGKAARAFQVGDKATIKCVIKLQENIELPTVGFLIQDRLGNEIFGTNTFHLKTQTISVRENETFQINFSTKLNLGVGNYSISIALHSRDTHLEDNYDWWDGAQVFQIIPNNEFTFIGVNALPVAAEFSKRVQ